MSHWKTELLSEIKGGRSHLDRDSFAETRKTVYGAEHRIIIYHSSGLERKRTIAFMRRFGKIYRRVKNIVESGDSDAMMKAKYYMETENLNETILLPTLAINGKRMRDRLSTFGRSALFTNIEDMKPEDLIDLYRKRNRVEHCFRTISMRDLASPVYHWTPQKIRVHMLFSHLAYLFLALIYNRARKVDDRVSLSSVLDVIGQVRLQYTVRGKEVKKKLDSRDPEALKIAEKLDLISVA